MLAHAAPHASSDLRVVGGASRPRSSDQLLPAPPRCLPCDLRCKVDRPREVPVGVAPPASDAPALGWAGASTGGPRQPLTTLSGVGIFDPTRVRIDASRRVVDLPLAVASGLPNHQSPVSTKFRRSPPSRRCRR